MKTTDLMIFPNMFIYLQDFFERTAEFLPQGIAVEDGPQQVTYAALERRANQLARVLLQNGGGPNARVGIFTAKNVQAYAGVLGTLKSGSCWAPLGENFPDWRLLFLLQSLEPVAVIVQDSTAQRMLALRQAHGLSFAIIQLDGAGRPGVIGPETLDAVSESRPAVPDRTPEDLAYIIFTSGSTGDPKGVMAYHRNICHFLNNCFDFFQITPGLRFAHHSELTFDPSLLDLFLCWGTGGTLVPMNRRSYRIDPFTYVRETGINYWFTVPTVLKALKKSGRLGQPELGSIQHLVLTGEPVPADLVNEWRRHYPHCAVYNFYGTTETVIISHWYKVEGELPEGAITPVGRPVPGVRIRLMDKGRPVEPGTPGESVVWGSQISPGYWRNAAENTTRFVEGLIDPALPQKAFRTGDLLRLREDGLYEYLGRLDRQVKVRGHRVELLEVEKAIMRVPGVEEVAVVACENASGIHEAHLVAVLHVSESFAEDSLRGFLESLLPEYMIPFSFLMDSAPLPRNANDKIDYLSIKSRIQAADGRTEAR